MDITRYKDQHVKILSGIAALRKLAHEGVTDHASEIADELAELSTSITKHLAIEDRILYPLLGRGDNAAIASMARRYQEDMEGIAAAVIRFIRKWGHRDHLSQEPERFRGEANVVLRDLHARIVRENREFYPAIEAL